jgi:hypothetical protein
VTDLRALSSDHSTLVLRPDVLDTCSFHLTNKELSDKSFYSISFRHLQVDDQESKVWRSAAPWSARFSASWRDVNDFLPTSAISITTWPPLRCVPPALLMKIQTTC